jgi:hypothetical protein
MRTSHASPLLHLAWLVLVVSWLWPVAAVGQCPGLTAAQTPFASETLTIGATALSLTKAIYQPTGVTPTMAMVSVEGGDIRHLEVGTPTATSGHPLQGIPSTTFPICGLDSIRGFKAIRVTSDATATITYYKTKTP